MSVVVEVGDLPGRLTEYPWAFLVTRSDERAHLLAVAPAWVDNGYRVAVGRSAATNVAERPAVTLAFPPQRSGQFSLLVDGIASVDAADPGVVHIVPSSAVLHRPAPPHDSSGPLAG